MSKVWKYFLCDKKEAGLMRMVIEQNALKYVCHLWSNVDNIELWFVSYWIFSAD